MIVAIIVLYHPDLSLLDRLVGTVLGQVDMIWAVDNTPGSSGSIEEFFYEYAGQINYEPLGDNKGIGVPAKIGLPGFIGG